MIKSADSNAKYPKTSLTEEDILIGTRMKEARIAKGLTQGGLGKIFGLSGQQIAKYESGLNRIAAKFLFKLAAVCDRSIEWFLQDLSEEDIDAYTATSKSRFVNRAMRQFHRIEDPQTQRRVLECLKVFSRNN